MRFIVASVSFGLLATAIVACSVQADEPVASGGEQHLTQVKPIAPATWAKCWFEPKDANDPFMHAYTLTCSGPEDAAYPLPIRTVTVSGIDAVGNQAVSGSLAPSQTALLGGVYADKLPLALTIDVVLAPRPESLVSAIEGSSFRFKESIDHPETITAEHPLVLQQPFVLWPITVLKKTSDSWFLAAERLEDVPASPYWFGGKNTTFDVTNGPVASTLTPDGVPVSFTLIAPPTGKLPAKFYGPTDADVIVDGPGTFVAEQSGFRRATDAEIAAAELAEDASVDAEADASADVVEADADVGP